jgi:serine/threonine protein phosphatase PrpC
LILLRTNFLIFRLELKETDEFVVIGCDGIWDCLTNEKAVEFVSTRIDDYKPTEIGTMMLNYIISPDPRVTQGIGGDNMTILIIDLQPTKRRWYRSSASETSTTMTDNNNINPTSGNNIIQPTPTK